LQEKHKIKKHTYTVQKYLQEKHKIKNILTRFKKPCRKSIK
jgi:hypothetical protein